MAASAMRGRTLSSTPRASRGPTYQADVVFCPLSPAHLAGMIGEEHGSGSPAHRAGPMKLREYSTPDPMSSILCGANKCTMEQAMDACMTKMERMDHIFGSVISSVSGVNFCTLQKSALGVHGDAQGLHLGDDEAGDMEPWDDADRPAFFFNMENLSYLVLDSNRPLWEKVEAEILDFVSSEQEGLGVEGASSVEAMGGFASTQFLVLLPKAASSPELKRRIKCDTWFKTKLAKRLTMLEGMEIAISAALFVLEVSPIVSEALVRFQGTWIKDSSYYEISGCRLRFPSGGSARIEGQPAGRAFNITHSSGATFSASLDPMGQVLKWSNGSVWHRSSEQMQLLHHKRAEENMLCNGPAEAVVPEEVNVEDGKIPQPAPWRTADGGMPLGEGANGMVQRLPDKNATAASPNLWGITARQCKTLLEEARAEGELPPDADMKAFVSRVVVPRTQGTGLGYALFANRDLPREVGTLVLHGGESKAAELLEVLWRSSVGADETFFMNALSLYLAEDGVGPSIASQLACGGAAALEEPSPEAPLAEEVRSVLDAVPQECASHSGRAAEFALSAVQARVQADWCKRAVCSALAPMPVVLAGCAVLIMYGHIIAWGCVPSPDFSKCGVRVQVEDLTWSKSAVWEWQKQWEDDRSMLSEGVQAAQRYLYVAASIAATLSAILWLVLDRCWPRGGRILVVPGPGRGKSSGEGLARFGLGEGAAHLVNTAHSLGIPIVMASGALVPLGLERRPLLCKPSRSTEAEAEPEVTDLKAVEEEAAAAILRRAAMRSRRMQSCTLLVWVALLGTLRVADLSLSLAGAWPWREASLCVVGSLLGVVLAALLLFRAARYYRGTFPLKAALVLPGLLLCVGFAIVAILVYTGLLLPGGIDGQPGGSEATRWFGSLDLATDEVARHVVGEAICEIHCRRSVKLAASMGQTLMALGASSLMVVFGSLLCPSRLRRCGSRIMAVLVLSFTLLLALSLAFARAMVVNSDGVAHSPVAGQRCGDGSLVCEMPMAEFSFTVAVYLVTQALARFAAPVCTLLRFSSLLGLTVRLPCRGRQQRRLKGPGSSSASSSSLEGAGDGDEEDGPQEERGPRQQQLVPPGSPIFRGVSPRLAGDTASPVGKSASRESQDFVTVDADGMLLVGVHNGSGGGVDPSRPGPDLGHASIPSALMMEFRPPDGPPAAQ